MSLGFGWTMSLQRSSFKRASRSDAKTGLFSSVFSVPFLGSVSEGFFFGFLKVLGSV